MFKDLDVLIVGIPAQAHKPDSGITSATFPEPLGFRLRDAALEQLLLAERHLSGEDANPHMGIHQARKCMRRTRAILALGMRRLDPRVDRLDDEIAGLCRGLSRLRDAHALIEALHRLSPEAGTDDGSVLSMAEAAARQRRDEMLSTESARDPGFLRRRRRLIAMRERLLRLDWMALDASGVEVAIARSEHRVRKARRRAKQRYDDEHDWHTFRRRVRRLRQQDTLLVALLPDLRPGTSGLDEQAASLGEAQDDVLILRHCGRGSPFGSADRRLLRQLASEHLRNARRK